MASFPTYPDFRAKDHIESRESADKGSHDALHDGLYAVRGSSETFVRRIALDPTKIAFLS